MPPAVAPTVVPSSAGLRCLLSVTVTVTVTVMATLTVAFAHHSYADYAHETEIAIDGTLSHFAFRNPHSVLEIDVVDAHGQTVRWIAEWGGAGTLLGQHVTAESLRAGERVIATGNPARAAHERRLRVLSVHAPGSGFRWGFAGEHSD